MRREFLDACQGCPDPVHPADIQALWKPLDAVLDGLADAELDDVIQALEVLGDMAREQPERAGRHLRTVDARR